MKEEWVRDTTRAWSGQVCLRAMGKGNVYWSKRKLLYPFLRVGWGGMVMVNLTHCVIFTSECWIASF